MTDESEYTLTIEVYKKGEDGVILRSSSGGSETGPLMLDDLLLETLYVFHDFLRKKMIENIRETKLIGQYLFNTLFSGDKIKNVLLNKFNEEEKIHLKIFFKNECAYLFKFPWELLYFAEWQGGTFLSTSLKLTLYRWEDLTLDPKSLVVHELPLKILVAISAPKDKKYDDFDQNKVESEFENLNNNGEFPIRVKIIKDSTPNLLENELKDFKPHILHFIGHGKFNDETKKNCMILLDEEGKGLEFEDEQLKDLILNANALPVLRLVFLQMCEGGIADLREGQSKTFSGFGPILIRSKIPAVIAMQFEIQEELANKFSKHFYNQIAKGEMIDVAVQIGRYQMAKPKIHSNRTFATPVLYMISSDAIIKKATQQKLKRENAITPAKIENKQIYNEKKSKTLPDQDFLRNNYESEKLHAPQTSPLQTRIVSSSLNTINNFLDYSSDRLNILFQEKQIDEDEYSDGYNFLSKIANKSGSITIPNIVTELFSLQRQEERSELKTLYHELFNYLINLNKQI